MLSLKVYNELSLEHRKIESSNQFEKKIKVNIKWNLPDEYSELWTFTVCFLSVTFHYYLLFIVTFINREALRTGYILIAAFLISLCVHRLIIIITIWINGSQSQKLKLQKFPLPHIKGIGMSLYILTLGVIWWLSILLYLPSKLAHLLSSLFDIWNQCYLFSNMADN